MKQALKVLVSSLLAAGAALAAPAVEEGDWRAAIEGGEKALWEERLDDAEPQLLAARSLARRPVEIARSIERLADLRGAQGDHTQAIGLYLEALEAWKPVLDPDQPRLGIPLNNLALIYLKECEVEAALPLVDRVDALWSGTDAVPPSYREAALQSAATLLDVCGRRQEATRLRARLASAP